jgi:hypothetical protein
MEFRSDKRFAEKLQGVVTLIELLKGARYRVSWIVEMKRRDCSYPTMSCLNNPTRNSLIDQSNLWTIGQLMEKPALPNGAVADCPVIKPSCA